MKPEIVALVGSQMQQEISKGFLENISGITDLIEAKFTQLEHSMINAISNEKTDSRIVQVETDFKA
jgi:hypothetical protein